MIISDVHEALRAAINHMPRYSSKSNRFCPKQTSSLSTYEASDINAYFSSIIWREIHVYRDNVIKHTLYYLRFSMLIALISFEMTHLSTSYVELRYAEYGIIKINIKNKITPYR